MKRTAEVVARVHLRATGMFFLRKPEEISRKPDLRLHLFFAVTEIVICNHRDHPTLFITASQLKGTAVIVELIGIFPAHAVAHLALGGLIEVR